MATTGHFLAFLSPTRPANFCQAFGKERLDVAFRFMNKSCRMQSMHSWNRPALWLAALATTTVPTTLLAEDWAENAISPVTNPVFFEDPQVRSEVRAIFMHHNIDDDFITQGGDAQLYAVQLRWAITERLAIIATKDGYVDFNPNAVLSKETGWADIAAGVKYALIDNKEAEFILTPGLTFEFPTGNSDVFQGNGDGTWNLFTSAGKGFGDLRLLGNFGGIIPNDFDEETAALHYSAQIDYTVCPQFVPFVALNAFTTISEGEALPLDTEGFDLFNFGSTDAEGTTQAVMGVGFRSHLFKSFNLGFAYEFPISRPEGLFGDRFTVDLIWRF